MRENGFRKHLQERKLNAKNIDSEVEAVKAFDTHLKKKKSNLQFASLDALKEYISILTKKDTDSEDRLVAIARYYRYVKRNDLFTYLASILGATNVLPDIGERLANIAGEEARRQVYHEIEFPSLGAPQDDYPCDGGTPFSETSVRSAQVICADQPVDRHASRDCRE